MADIKKKTRRKPAPETGVESPEKKPADKRRYYLIRFNSIHWKKRFIKRFESISSAEYAELDSNVIRDSFIPEGATVNKWVWSFMPDELKSKFQKEV